MPRAQPHTQSFARTAHLVALAGLALGGCSSAPGTLGVSNPSYLGARDVATNQSSERLTEPRVTSSKVLSAIVFERVTGVEIDPSRLVQP